MAYAGSFISVILLSYFCLHVRKVCSGMKFLSNIVIIIIIVIINIIIMLMLFMVLMGTGD